ncbi:hypothetical protein [Gracilimonas sp.]|uniref:hypothetical protein n=1 Tax=Gracilimonas sp. TaxID=1974203 RepID=UPI002871A462|nr:hypothetical protein [Gracilimonas sp.]
MKKNKFYSVALGIGIFAICFFAAYSLKIYSLNFDIIISSQEEVKRTENSKEEIVLTYIGSSTCVYCRSPKLDSALNSVASELEEISSNQKLNFNKVGLTRDRNKVSGIKHLLGLKVSFDEISSGNSWRNLGLNHYTNVHEAIYATPQILLSKRTYADSLLSNRIWNPVVKEKILARYVGLDKITEINLSKISF